MLYAAPTEVAVAYPSHAMKPFTLAAFMLAFAMSAFAQGPVTLPTARIRVLGITVDAKMAHAGSWIQKQR
ncbi:unnamed protein product [Cercospora beticola]|nr:unnamed protein product [Cercospora beticola]